MSRSNHLPSDRDQGRLFPDENPLPKRLGADFFEMLPRSPGVYKMYGIDGALLYVGKAKNLRTRLFTYKRVRREKVSRKVLRLVQMIREIRIEVLPDEESALLRENELIRTAKPPFNVAKKQPEAYYFIGLKAEGKALHLRLTMRQEKQDGEQLYGAFKGHGRVRKALGALLRQLHILHHEIASPFEFPPLLTRRLTPGHFTLQLNENWPDRKRRKNSSEVRRYLKGTGITLLDRFNEAALDRDLLSTFMGKLVLEDLERLRNFYEKGPKINYAIYRSMNLEHPLIPQQQLDDVLIRHAFLNEET